MGQLVTLTLIRFQWRLNHQINTRRFEQCRKPFAPELSPNLGDGRDQAAAA
jgi:hypothetical protein